MKTRLNVRLLGGVQLIWDGAPLTTAHSPRLQSLLAYLVLHRDAPQSRRHLAFLLFPDSPEAQARTNLRNLFHLLRNAIPQADDFLCGDAQCLQWRNDAPYTLDVQAFEAAIRNAAQPADWENALALYQGDLAPDCYDDWILSERERLRLLYLDALERVCDARQAARDAPTARKYAQLLLNADPLREDTYRRLMRLAAQQGDRAGVMRFYNQCVNVLARELDVEPSAETHAAYQECSRVAAQVQSEASASPDGKRLDNLPLQLTNLIGRADDVQAIREIISMNRLVTLSGAGGVGKTRLALAAAQELREDFTDGVWLVNLAPLSDGALIAQSIAGALKVRETPGAALADSVRNFLCHKQLLLVLDNCEHLIEPVRAMTEQLLHAAPQLHLLVTSRRVLDLTGEAVWRVSPLAAPQVQSSDSVGASLQYSSVQLFVERARGAFASFALTNENVCAVAQICRRLDGIPLAIELAAARVNLLDVRDIATRLDDTFHLLTRGDKRALPHQQTMRATLDWSFETLDERERKLFRRLSVFAGGFTVDAVEAVCADAESAHGEDTIAQGEILDLLSNLIDKSLVATISEDHKPRARLLEPIREYAREKLEAAGEAASIRNRHLDFCIAIAEQSELPLRGAAQDEWLIRLDELYDNLRVAAEWALCPERAEKGLRLIGAFPSFFFLRGNTGEWRIRAEKLLSLYGATKMTLVRAKALFATALVADDQGDVNSFTEHMKEAVAIAREHGPAGKPLLAWALTELSLSEYAKKSTFAQNATIESWALVQELGDNWLTAIWLHYKGHEFQAQNNLEMARSLYEQSRKLFVGVGDKQNAVLLSRDVAYLNFLEGDYSTARTQVEETLGFFRAHKEWKETQKELRILGEIAYVTGDYELAEKRYAESLALSREYDDQSHTSLVLSLVGLCVLERGDVSRAQTMFEEALTLAQETRASDVVRAVERFALLATLEKQSVRAAKLMGYVETQKKELAIVPRPTDAQEHQEILTFIHSASDQEKIQAAWEDGAAMSKEQAIAYALSDD